jgi:TMEM175 potassium channel family protein
MSDLFKEKDRIEFFSDGVFAIAITLLGLELKVPELGVAGASSMWQTLGAQWHSYVAIIISFVTIFLIWIPHHMMLKIAHNVSYNLFLTNGFLLLIIICFPFATRLLGEYFNTPANKTVSAVYASLCFFVDFAFFLFWKAVISTKREWPSKERKVFQIIFRNMFIGFAVYAIAFVGSFLSAYVGMAICVAMWLFWAAYLNLFKKLQ